MKVSGRADGSCRLVFIALIFNSLKIQTQQLMSLCYQRITTRKLTSYCYYDAITSSFGQSLNKYLQMCRETTGAQGRKKDPQGS